MGYIFWHGKLKTAKNINKNLTVYPVSDWQPVLGNQNRCEKVSWANDTDNSCTYILNILKLLQMFSVIPASRVLA